MRIDLPSCSFTDCRHNQDNNCFAKGGNREGCEFRILDEKQTPKEPTKQAHRYHCPSCNGIVGYVECGCIKYCDECGQSIKQSDGK